MSDRSWSIGRAPDCDVVIQNPAVSSRHCRLTLSDKGLILEDLKSANGTYVNGVRVTEPLAVYPEDRITLGQTISFPWPDGSLPDTNLLPPEKAGHAVAATQAISAGTQTVTIGRAADNDITLDYPTVSGHHARIVTLDGQAFIEDLNSTNGTALSQPGKRIKRAPIGPSDVVFFGSLRMPASRLFEGKLNLGSKAHESVSFDVPVMVFGRHPSCDKVLSNPSVSARHAKLTRAGNEFQIEDLGSSNGTYVNGRKVIEPTRVNPGDVIALGTYTFLLDARGNLEQQDLQGNVTLEVRGISVDVPGKRLLEDVSLTIYPGEFVGLMGPSGAGKTTLMNALNGYTPPSTGQVLINGESLYDDYERFAPYIGYVPQDDIMHRDLTVGQALYYTARLRLPPDFTDEEIHKRIDDILKQIELEGAKNVLIGSPEKKGISGGQRKRVNLAMELLSDPLVLFLDEPTSGLSSRDAFNVMQLLRKLADSGKTILLTIHQPSLDVFRLMDSLAMVSKDTNSADPGRLVYFGPNYPDAVHFFNPNGLPNQKADSEPTPEEIFNGLDRNGKTSEWRQRFVTSKYHQQYVVERAGKPASTKGLADASRGGAFDLGQLWTLVKRCATIKKSDLITTLIMLLQAPTIALLAVLLFGKNLGDFDKMIDDHTITQEAAAAAQRSLVGLVFFTCLAALFFGCFNSVREIVGEWAIYRRERMVCLKIIPYLASKWIVLGTFCVLQSLMLLAIIHFMCKLRGPWNAIFVFVLLNSLIGMGLGLLISAMSKTNERAMGMVVLIVLMMVLFGGALIPLHETYKAGSYIAGAMSQRWAFEGVLVTEVEAGGDARKFYFKMPDGKVKTTDDMASKHFPTEKKKTSESEAENFRLGPMISFGALAAMLVVVIVVPAIILRMRDIH